jgi:hypothetical protein
MRLRTIFLLITSLLPCNCLLKGNSFKPNPLQPGPWVEMSKGMVWPKPQHQTFSDEYLILDPTKFKFKVIFHF